MLQQIVSLWVGGGIGTIEKLGLRSFVAQGHPVALYSYGEIDGLPPGVELRNADEVMPRAQALTHRYPNGSFALLADIFRLELQQRELGIWVDTDVIALRPLDLPATFIAGRESELHLNNAVLRLPADSPMLRDWIAATRSGRVPTWLPFSRAPTAYLAQTLGRRVTPSALPFGTFGPKAITNLAKRHRLAAAAQPVDVFYPLPPRDAIRLWQPGLTLGSVITERTLAIHLWNEKLKQLKHTPPPERSVMAELLRRYPE